MGGQAPAAALNSAAQGMAMGYLTEGPRTRRRTTTGSCGSVAESLLIAARSLEGAAVWGATLPPARDGLTGTHDL